MTPPTWIGQTLSGRYRMDALLGQGGMSAVYKATDPNLHRTVAVKLIHPHLSTDDSFVQRFRQEAAAVAQLRHPNIIQVHDFDRDGDTLYMVLEYVPGETLQSRLKTLSSAGRRLPVADIVPIMASVCDAVAYAHAHGMIHRDLKPANVMLHPQGQPILMDFGVAKMAGGGQHTATGAIIGTALYMSPEQVRGERIDERSDLYSLGVMLYEMTSGRPPFEADSAMTVMLMHVNEPIPDIRLANASTPPELAEIIVKSLAKSPADRFQTAAEMAAALRAVPLGLSADRTIASATALGVSPVPKTGQTGPMPLPAAAGAGPVAAGETVQAPVRGAAAVPPPERAKGRRIPAMVWMAGLIVSMLCLTVFGLMGLRQLRNRGIAGLPGSETNVSPAASASPTSPAITQAPPTERPRVVRTLVAGALEGPSGMVAIPEGKAGMGSEAGAPDEAPVHAVLISAFYMDQFEVTNGRYLGCVDAKQCLLPAMRDSEKRAAYFLSLEFRNYPVVGVSWDQADAFCKWEGKRLPSEAEWEYAASGGDGRRYPWGNDFVLDFVPAKETDTQPVGSHRGDLSPFGVSGMAGNVQEWVADWYSRDYYSRAEGENPHGPPDGKHRVVRGGAFGDPNPDLYTVSRRSSQPPETQNGAIGFRCVVSAERP